MRLNFHPLTVATLAATTFFSLGLGEFSVARIAAQEAEATPAAAPPAELKVELLEPGAEPRRELRFTPNVGDTQVAEMTIKMNQQLTIGGNAIPSQVIPAQKMTMEVTVSEVADNGDITFRYEYTDVSVVDDPNNPSPIAATLETMLRPMIGATGMGIVTDRGITRKGEFNIPDELAPELKQMLEGMKDAINRLSSPVPAEPVGKGAKWKVVQDMNANGMKLTQTSTNEILDLNAEGFQMSVTVDQNAKPQKIENPMLPEGTQMTLDSLKSDGKGTSTLVTNSVLPVTSDVVVNTVANMSIDAAGQKQQMQMKVKMEMLLDQVE